jgi:aryl-alcohol dehydrogenase-like predicted oxidoreductase
MQYREPGCAGWKVSAVSFGAWAIGGTWVSGIVCGFASRPDPAGTVKRLRIGWAFP